MKQREVAAVQLVGGSSCLVTTTPTQLISAAYQLICITAPWIGVGFVDGKTPKAECSPEDIVMPMCRSPRTPDALLQAGRPPANDNHPPAKIGIGSPRKTNRTVKAGWQAILILCVATLLLL